MEPARRRCSTRRADTPRTLQRHARGQKRAGSRTSVQSADVDTQIGFKVAMWIHRCQALAETCGVQARSDRTLSLELLIAAPYVTYLPRRTRRLARQLDAARAVRARRARLTGAFVIHGPRDAVPLQLEPVVARARHLPAAPASPISAPALTQKAHTVGQTVPARSDPGAASGGCSRA
eukprot:1224481-Rhodomonas_salina.11